jgi:hypothetical protein
MPRNYSVQSRSKSRRKVRHVAREMSRRGQSKKYRTKYRDYARKLSSKQKRGPSSKRIHRVRESLRTLRSGKRKRKPKPIHGHDGRPASYDGDSVAYRTRSSSNRIKRDEPRRYIREPQKYATPTTPRGHIHYNFEREDLRFTGNRS